MVDGVGELDQKRRRFEFRSSAETQKGRRVVAADLTAAAPSSSVDLSRFVRIDDLDVDVLLLPRQIEISKSQSGSLFILAQSQSLPSLQSSSVRPVLSETTERKDADSPVELEKYETTVVVDSPPPFRRRRRHPFALRSSASNSATFLRASSVATIFALCRSAETSAILLLMSSADVSTNSNIFCS